MTVTQTQIDLVREKGFANVPYIAEAANLTDTHFYIAVTMIGKETSGRNVYGHDVNGALSGFPGEVNFGSYEVFKWLRTQGKGPNGIGPSQITSQGLLDEMKARGLSVINPRDNILFGVELIGKYYRAARDKGLSVNNALWQAGKRYNGADAYADSFLRAALDWRARLGKADYA